LSRDQAVINRFGFNNQGHAAVLQRLEARRHRGGLVGVNIGANKDATDRTADYVSGIKTFLAVADYFVVNISSPNTPGLRALQTKAALDELLGRLGEARAALTQTLPRGAVPILLKVAPDLEDGEVESITAGVQAHGLTGSIISNTTISRPASLTGAHRGEIGGLSGAPLLALSTEMLRRFHACAGGKLALIGAGGVSSGADAYAKIRAGACAVQIYSALAYQGPGLIGRIKTDLAAHLRADGFTRLEQAVGQA
jgi:dihydroorotate dehydrogenase